MNQKIGRNLFSTVSFLLTNINSLLFNEILQLVLRILGPGLVQFRLFFLLRCFFLFVFLPAHKRPSPFYQKHFLNLRSFLNARLMKRRILFFNTLLCPGVIRSIIWR